MRLRQKWLRCIILSVLAILALLFAACATGAPDTGGEADTAMEEAAPDEAMSETTDAHLAVNPATVDSDRLLILPGRGRYGVGVWGSITASNWNFSSESYYNLNSE